MAGSEPLQTPLELLKQVDDWRSFVETLEQCDRWWSNRQRWSVLGEPQSWRETIQVLHHIVREDWRELSNYNRKRLLGLTTREDDWALLGRMRGAAQKSVFGNNSEKIQAVVRHVVAAFDADFPRVGIEAYEVLERCCMDRGGDGIRPFPSGSVRRYVRTQAVRVRSLCSGLSGRPGSP